MKVVLVGVPYINTRIPPLSIALLAGHLRQNDFEVASVDLNIEAYKAAPEDLKKYWKMTQGFQWAEKDIFDAILFPRLVEPNLGGWVSMILEHKPDVVGISATASPMAKIIGRQIRQRSPQVKIIYGGPTCSKFYGDDSYKDPTVSDAVVDGEGEETLLDLMNKYRDHGEFVPVPGASVYYQGQFVDGGFRPGVKDLDSLAPPDFEDFDLADYTDEDSYGGKKEFLEVPVYSSRGCVAKCHFCMDYKMWQSYRFKSAKAFVQELKYLRDKYGAGQYFFVELLFNGSHKWVREYAAEMKKEGLHFPFHSHGRISKNMTPELLRNLREVGLFHLNYGLESASDKVLKLMTKGYGYREASRCIIDTHNAGISMSINLVIGYPGETTKEWLKTLWFIIRHRKFINSKPNMAICDVIPGADLHQNPEKFGITFDPKDPYFFSNWQTIDGKNTFKVRKFRRDIMDYVFSRIRFHEYYRERDRLRGQNKTGDKSLGRLLKKLYIAQPRRHDSPGLK